MRANTYPGTFIVLEGIDGSGTTTQVKQLAQRLRALGYTVTTTAEPSNGPIGRLLRKFLGNALPRPAGDMLSWMLTLLFSADRIEHLSTDVEPALQRGHVVLCDRYVLSTYAYQADIIGDACTHWITQVSDNALCPDLTVVLNVDPEKGMRRLEGRGRKEFYEKLEIQQRVARNYLSLVDWAGLGAIVLMEGEGAPDEIADQLLALARPYIKELKRT